MAQDRPAERARPAQRTGLPRPRGATRRARNRRRAGRRPGVRIDALEQQPGGEPGQADRLPEQPGWFAVAARHRRVHLPAPHAPGIPGGLPPDRP